MFRICTTILVLSSTIVHVCAQTVTNVRFEQVNKQVKITYNLDKQADISVSVSDDGGTTWHGPLKQVSGDVGKQVQPGSKTIYWDVLAECNQLVGDKICFKVIPMKDDNLSCEVKSSDDFNLRIIPSENKNLSIVINNLSFSMIYVQGGTFTMGAKTKKEYDDYKRNVPAHQVMLNDYYIGEFELTQELWFEVMGTTIQHQIIKKGEKYDSGVGNNFPMYYISWEDCQEFISKLNEKMEISKDSRRFALPTEAQWEYAARGGQQSKNYIYAGSNQLNKVAWFEKNSKVKIHSLMNWRTNSKVELSHSFKNWRIHPIGQKQPNELGLYDMSGNVAEWCQDWYGIYYYGSQTNPIGHKSGMNRITRGGHYMSEFKDCRVAHRGCCKPDSSYPAIGMRLVLLP